MDHAGSRRRKTFFFLSGTADHIYGCPVFGQYICDRVSDPAASAGNDTGASFKFFHDDICLLKIIKQIEDL